MNSKPTVDVVIVAHNAGRTLEDLLGDLRSSLDVTCRTTVVDNASTDNTPTLADSLADTLITPAANLGYGAGFNLGLRQATSDWVVCANQDLRVPPSTLRQLIDAATDAERLHAAPCLVGPRLVDSTGTLTETFHQLPTLSRTLCELLFGESAAGYRRRTPLSPGPQQCGWLSAAFTVARRDTFERLGGFDPSYFMYVEDLDLFSRAADLGFGAVWVPDACVIHFGGDRAIISPLLFAHSLWGWSHYYETRRGRLAGLTVQLAGIVGVLGRACRWEIRARRGHPDGRVMSRTLFRAARYHAEAVISGHRPTIPSLPPPLRL